MIDLDTMPPDWSFAQNHARAVKPGIAEGLHVKTGKSVFCQCCLKPVQKQMVSLFANSKELEFLGFGFPLYYIYLKYCIILVLILICSYSAISLYAAVELNQSFCLSHRLLSSSGSSSPHCTSFLIMFARIEDHVASSQLILRISSFIIHLAALIYIRDNIRKTVQYYDEKTTSLSDYSFIMKNLPLKDDIQQDIKNFVNNKFMENWQQFENTYHHEHLKASVSKVMQITLIPELDEYFKLDQEKRHLIEEKRKLLISEQRIGVSSKVQPVEQATILETAMQSIDAQLRTIKNKIIEFKSDFKQKVQKDKLHSKIAIVTLNTQMHKNVVLQFAEENILTKQVVGEYFGDFQGKIKILQAPQPNEIIWENIRYSNKDRIIGKIIGWTLTIIFIGVCTVGFYFILVLKTNTLLHAMESYVSQEQMKRSSAYKISVFLVFLMMFLIVLFNKLVMSWALHQFTHLEKHEHASDEEFSFALKYTIGLFFTTALMTLAVEDITYHNFFSHEYGVIEEESIMFFVNALFIPIFMLINPHQLKNRIMRYFKKGKKHFTQGEANKIISDNPYSMGKQYAEIVETLWFTFLYATMVPMGAFITIIGLSLYYWVDKYNLLRRSSLSHNISGEMVMVSLKLLDCTLVMKPVGEIIFDSGIRNHIQNESIILTAIAFIYICIPMDSILEFFHSESFEQEEKTFAQVQHTFLQTYKTLHPVMNYEVENIFKNLQKNISKQISLTTAFDVINHNMIEALISPEQSLQINSPAMMKPIVKVPMGSLKSLLKQFESPSKHPLKVTRSTSRRGLMKMKKPQADVPDAFITNDSI